MNDLLDELSEIGETTSQGEKEIVLLRRCLNPPCNKRFNASEDSEERYCSSECEDAVVRSIIFEEYKKVNNQESNEERLKAVCYAGHTILKSVELEMVAFKNGFDLNLLDPISL